jgi:hypothetical protein
LDFDPYWDWENHLDLGNLSYMVEKEMVMAYLFVPTHGVEGLGKAI